MSTIPREEIEQDLKATIADELRCSIIVENIEGFMRESGGEDRSGFRFEVFRWQGHLASARKLRATIEELLKDKVE